MLGVVMRILKMLDSETNKMSPHLRVYPSSKDVLNKSNVMPRLSEPPKLYYKAYVTRKSANTRHNFGIFAKSTQFSRHKIKQLNGNTPRSQIRLHEDELE
ncbi:hypothetical protein AB6A40_002312 [Gnathostoma spinigerum]|uniref:Uncharacterized protein n=1 Tax=Gnathostoma spinigerum TaxID=75299 RepID=A0ABD6E6E4_9BILA